MMDSSQGGRGECLTSHSATKASASGETDSIMLQASPTAGPSSAALDKSASSMSQHHQSTNSNSEFSPFFLVAAAAASAQAEAARAANLQPSTSTPSSSSAINNVNSNTDSAQHFYIPPLPYLDKSTPFPMALGSRIVKPSPTKRNPSNRNGRSRKVEDLGKLRCSWAILSTTTKKLTFMYADPTFNRHLSSEASKLVGTSFFDYIHPEERDRAEVDMKNIIDSRTLFGSVTRCRYSRMHRIRSLLGAVDPPIPAECDDLEQEEKDYLAIDIVVNWIGEGMALCFFHAIMDESIKDNDELDKTDWSNWCGMEPDLYNQDECQKVWQSIKDHRMLRTLSTGPEYVFQILSAVPHEDTTASNSSNILFSWPPPRLFSAPTNDTLTASSMSFADGSYFVDDFARLAQGVNLLTLKKELSDANTSCTRRFRAKHTLTTEGMIRSVESVLIPYGSIVLACFSVTYAQRFPGSAAVATTFTSTADVRNNSSAAADDSPNKTGQSQNGSQQNKVVTNDHHISSIRDPHFDISIQYSKGDLIATPALASLVDASMSVAKKDETLTKNDDNVVAAAVEERDDNVATLAAVAAAAAAQSKRCASCGASNSPEWRKGPDGNKSLCNACGLRYSRNISRAIKREERALLAAEVAANGGIIPPHLLKKQGADDKKQKKKKQKTKHASKEEVTSKEEEAAATVSGATSAASESIPVTAPASASASTTTASTIDPITINEQKDDNNNNDDDDASIQLARAAAQAAAAAGLRQS